MIGTISFGEPDAPLPDWHAEREATDGDEDRPLTPGEHKAIVGMLGFDPDEEQAKPAP